MFKDKCEKGWRKKKKENNQKGVVSGLCFFLFSFLCLFLICREGSMMYVCNYSFTNILYISFAAISPLKLLYKTKTKIKTFEIDTTSSVVSFVAGSRSAISNLPQQLLTNSEHRLYTLQTLFLHKLHSDNVWNVHVTVMLLQFILQM